MYSLCDSIEKYIIRMIESSPNQMIVIQRGKLADEFDCAPSQINYVLATRFSVFRGFIVESRRGGSGYVRIKKVPIDRLEPIVFYLDDYERNLKESDVEDLVNWLERERFITFREGLLMKAAMIQALSKVEDLGLSSNLEKNCLRSRILREMLLQILDWVK